MTDGESSLQKKYSFTREEYEKVLNLFSVLQYDISSAGNLPDKTRTKVLGKLEEMILYFEISVNNLDVFWSFIGRSEIAFKVYGENIIPDSLKELAKTIWKVQCREEGRPSNSTPPILF
jgi:hypothetical protein